MYAEDLARALRFYRDLLGFTETYRFPAEGEPEFVALALGAAHLALAGVGGATEGSHGRPILRPVSGHRFELCVYTDDVDAALEQLRAAGVPVLKEAADQPWGERMGYVEDPDGNPILVTATLKE